MLHHRHLLAESERRRQAHTCPTHGFHSSIQCGLCAPPDLRDAEIKALRSRVAGLEASLGWAIGWVAEEIEPCKRRYEGCPWGKDHDQLDAARALLGSVEKP